jgi:hypothetical protein
VAQPFLEGSVSQVQRINLRHTDRQYLHRDLQKPTFPR